MKPTRTSGWANPSAEAPASARSGARFSPERTTWTVAELARHVGDAVEAAFAREIWVRGEIGGFSRAPSGHVYFSLLEPGDDDRRTTRMPAALFRNHQRTVDAQLAAAGGLSLADGVEVRIRARVEYYAPRAQAQLIMTAVDPVFTLGALAADRERTWAELCQSGLAEQNRCRPMPLVPLRVGLATADASAACADFLDELAASGYAFAVTLCDTRVTGLQAAPEIAAAVGALSRAADDGALDVIALVRGGGDRTELMAFDSLEAASAVARCPVPVFCGIGHEIDTTIVDRVAHTSAKTPTACAAALVDHVAAFDAAIEDRRLRLSRLADRALRSHADRLSRARSTVVTTAQHRIAAPMQRLGRLRLGLVRHAGRYTAAERTRLTAARLGLNSTRILAADERKRLNRAAKALSDNASAQLRLAHERIERSTALVAALSPRRTLARGFSITRDSNGRVLRHVPAPGDVIGTETLHSVIRSTVAAAEASHGTPHHPTETHEAEQP